MKFKNGNRVYMLHAGHWAAKGTMEALSYVIYNTETGEVTLL